MQDNLFEYKYRMEGYRQCLLDIIGILEGTSVINVNFLKSKKDVLKLLKTVLEQRENFINNKDFMIVAKTYKNGKKLFEGIKYY